MGAGSPFRRRTVKEIDDRGLRRARRRQSEKVERIARGRRTWPQSKRVSWRCSALGERSTYRTRPVEDLLIDNGTLLPQTRRSGLAELEKGRRRAAFDKARQKRN